MLFRSYVAGGYSSAGSVSGFEVFDTRTETREELPPMPTARQSFAACAIDDRFIWTFGGFSDKSPSFLDVIEIFDIETNNWSRSELKLPTARAFLPTAVVSGSKIFIVGGCKEGFNRIAEIDILDLETMSWGKGPPMENPRMWHGIVGF